MSAWEASYRTHPKERMTFKTVREIYLLFYLLKVAPED